MAAALLLRPLLLHRSEPRPAVPQPPPALSSRCADPLAQPPRADRPNGLRRSRPTTQNAPKNKPSPAAMIWPTGTLIPRRYLVGSCPSGAVRSFIVMGDPVPDQPATRESRRRAYHGIPCGRRSAGGTRRAFASPRTKRGGLVPPPPHCSLCAPSISWEPPLSDSAGKRRCWLFRATGQEPS